MAMKNLRNGWLKRAFAAAVLLPVLAGTAQAALTYEETGHKAQNDAATFVTDTASFEGLVQNMCAGADVVLVGDTDHTDLSLRQVMGSHEFADALKSCGVTDLFLEMPVTLQPELDRFQAGELSSAEFQNVLSTRRDNLYSLAPESWQEMNRLDAALIENAHAAGMKIYAADPGTEGDSSAVMSVIISQGALLRLKRVLGEENPAYRDYYDLFMADRGDEIPAEEKAVFEESFVRLYQELEIDRLFTQADSLREEGIQKRLNDTMLAGLILDKLEDSSKALVFYGAAHMSSARPDGLDNLLAETKRLKRIDIAPSITSAVYKEGADRPDAVFITDTKSVMQFEKKAVTAAVLPAAPHNGRK
ncbi:MAG: hypothetical protein HND56_02660 [Pseudomonadota bacterium]|nr:hypothetical protein [Pseudomonadota bacterium]QKK04655.1 MAG: hypothetical protein HND56_02660 [Pseudomonadota bacterium]